MMEAIRISHELLAKAGASTLSFAPGDVIFKDGDAPDRRCMSWSTAKWR